MSSTPTKISTQVAILLICLSDGRAFSSSRPLSSTRSKPNPWHGISRTAQLHEVLDMGSESSEQPTVLTAVSSQPRQENLDPLAPNEPDASEAVAAQIEDEGLRIWPNQDPLGPTLTERDIPALPTMKELCSFALPCFGLLLSGPLLSLIDTAFVGLASTDALELAALGPATTLFDCLTWFLSFLNVATINLYSNALAKGHPNEAESVVRTGSRIALTVGLLLMSILIAFCKPILAGYMGVKAAATPGLLAGASTYLMIRALSMPSFLLLGVLQSALLGAKDSTTPLLAIGYSSVVNLMGDFLLVNVFGMGLRGAAIATTAAQWAATLALLLPARKKLMTDGKLGLLDFQRKSDIGAREFLSFSAPVILLMAGKLGVFGVLTQGAARVPGQPTPLASHQLILSLLIFLCPFVDVLNQIAQSFLPPFFALVKEYIDKMKHLHPQYNEKDDAIVQKWKDASGKFSLRLIQACYVFGALAATAGWVIPRSFGHLLTGDVAVQRSIRPLAKFLWWSTFLMGPMLATEGILLAQNKAWFLVCQYAVSSAVFPYLLFHFGSGSVSGVWTCFTLFQVYRSTLQTLKATEMTPGKIWKKSINLIGLPFRGAIG